MSQSQSVECWANATLDGKHHYMGWIGQDEADFVCDCGARKPISEQEVER